MEIRYNEPGNIPAEFILSIHKKVKV